MKFTPRSTALLRTRLASSRSLGSPQMPLPVRRIAPYPRRFTSMSPPILNVFCTALMRFSNIVLSVDTSHELPDSVQGMDERRCTRDSPPESLHLHLDIRSRAARYRSSPK